MVPASPLRVVPFSTATVTSPGSSGIASGSGHSTCAGSGPRDFGEITPGSADGSCSSPTAYTPIPISATASTENIASWVARSRRVRRSRWSRRRTSSAERP